MTRGIVFFNFGGSCVARLLVALHSLRKYHSSVNVTVFLAQDDRFNLRAAPDIEKFAQISWFDLKAIASRNMKCVIKPTLFEMSPYDSTLMMDGDLLFQADPGELFGPLEEQGLLLTKFSTWNTDGSKMAQRIEKFKGDFSPGDWLTVSSLNPLKGKIAAVNIGVMGLVKQRNAAVDPIAFLSKWKEFTMKVAGQHMADEHAAQVLYPFYTCALAGAEWNQSCVYPSDKDYSRAKIIHYHGHKESEPNRGSSRRWLQAFEALARTQEFPGLLEYSCWQGESLLNNLVRSGVLADPSTSMTP